MKTPRSPFRFLPALAAVFFATTAGGAPPPRPAPRTPDVLLVGLDGADLATVDRLLAAGVSLPNFRKLLGEGFSVPVSAFDPVLSPPLWTTIATGRTPVDHGIWDFLEIDPSGGAVPATSLSRRVRAFWNVAAENDVPVAVLGWYATWPAEKVRGAVVSDRMVAHQVEAGETPTEGITFPADLAASLEPKRPTVEEGRREVLERFVHGEPPVGSEERIDGLVETWRGSELLRRSWGPVLDRFHPRIAAIYLDLPDAAGHLVADAARPRLPETSDAEDAAFGESWERVWRWLDGVLGELVARAGKETTIVVCSDHGFKDGADRPHRSGRVKTGMAGLWHRRNGMLAISGPGVRRGVRGSRPVAIEDLFPTLMAVARLPLSREVVGRVVDEAFVETPRPTRVASYEGKPMPRPKRPKIEAREADEALHRLRALGYLGGSETVSPGTGGRTARSLQNEGVWRMSRGDAAGAVALFREALAADPKLDDARVSLASTLANAGELDAAEAEAERIPEGHERLPVLLLRGSIALARGKVETGCALAKEAATVDDRDPGLALLEARCALASGRPEEAAALAPRVVATADVVADADEARRVRAEALEKMGRRDEAIAEARGVLAAVPSLSEALLLGDLLARAGRPAEALEAFGRGSALVADSPAPHLRAGLLRLGEKQYAAAGKSYREALARAPTGRSRELARLGLALVALVADDTTAARKELEAGLAENPGSGPLHEQLGMIEARERHWPEAAEHLRAAARVDPSPRVLTPLAFVLAGAGRAEEALEAGRRSLALDADQPELRGLVDELAKAR